MSPVPDLPLWAAIIVSLAVLVGAAFSLIGAVGLLRLGSFFERLHPPTLASTFGAGFILIGSVVALWVTEGRPMIHQFLLLVFVTVTTPVTMMSLGRAALFRKTSGE